MNRLLGILAATLIVGLTNSARADGDQPWLHGSPPTEGTAHIHLRYLQADARRQAGVNGSGFAAGPAFGGPWSTGYNAVGYNRFSTGSYGNLNTPGVPSKQPYYGFGSLNYGPFGTGMFGNNQSSGVGNGNANYRNGNSGGYGRYGYGGYGGFGGFGGYGWGGAGFGGGMGGYGPYGMYGYGASGALGYGDPHARYYFGASPYNSPSTYRYGGHSAIPHVPPFQNFAHPSGLAPYSYLYVNPRTPQGPDHPVTVENPFVKQQVNGAVSHAGEGETSPAK